MKNYLFFISEGFTFDPKNKEIQNMQILGDVVKNLELNCVKIKPIA